MEVILTEKKSVASDIAAVLGIKARSQFSIETLDGRTLVWARGHLLELVEPDDYSEAWAARWNWDQLPMIPEKWKYRVVRGCGDQMKAIAAVLKRATSVVIATDAAREGELIGRLILEHCKYRGPVKRFWASVLTPKGIKEALDTLRPGKSTENLLEAAKARSYADWLYGLTGSRAVALATRIRGGNSLGRVQTPTLALLVHRQEQIDNFRQSTYYELEATVRTARGAEFKMLHAPSAEHRITNKADAEKLMKQAQGHQGPLRVVKEPGSQRPPLPFSLPTLQKEANRLLGLSAADTLKIAQTLYEAKFTTYPRTDCEYLGDKQKEEVPAILDAISENSPLRVLHLKDAGVLMRPSVFDNSKLSDHHGLIPTYLPARGLTGDTAKVYDLVCLRFLQSLAPDQRFDQTAVMMDANGVEFRAKDRVVTDEGWRALARIA